MNISSDEDEEAKKHHSTKVRLNTFRLSINLN